MTSLPILMWVIILCTLLWTLKYVTCNFWSICCMQLIAEFKRLGSNIVYASFSQMILCTKKRRVDDALAYIEFITNSIRSRELYRLIDISYTKYWQTLIWMDPVSYSVCLHLSIFLFVFLFINYMLLSYPD